MVQKWVFNTGAVLFDLEYENLHFLPFAVLVLAVIAASVAVTVRYSEKRQWSFLMLFGGVIPAAIVVQDIHSKTYYSTIARYLTPLWLSLECTMAFSFAWLLRRQHPLLRSGGAALLVTVLLLGSWSSAVADRKEAWWDQPYQCGFARARAHRRRNWPPIAHYCVSARCRSRLESLSASDRHTADDGGYTPFTHSLGV